MDTKETAELEKISLLNHLRDLRYNWTDEIPEKVIHSPSKINSKARSSWFAGVVADSFNLVEEGFLKSTQALEAADELIKRFTTENFKIQELTTREDIDTANRLIDIILTNTPI